MTVFFLNDSCFPLSSMTVFLNVSCKYTFTVDRCPEPAGEYLFLVFQATGGERFLVYRLNEQVAHNKNEMIFHVEEMRTSRKNEYYTRAVFLNVSRKHAFAVNRCVTSPREDTCSLSSRRQDVRIPGVLHGRPKKT